MKQDNKPTRGLGLFGNVQPVPPRPFQEVPRPLGAEEGKNEIDAATFPLAARAEKEKAARIAEIEEQRRRDMWRRQYPNRPYPGDDAA